MSVLYLSVYFLSTLAALGLGLMCAVTDMRTMKIPNAYALFVAVAFPAAFLAAHMAGADVFDRVRDHVLAGAIVFGATFAMYVFKTLGAGDSKLAAAYALWAGLSGLVGFLFYTALAGGVLAVATLLVARFKPFKQVREGSWPARVQAGERVVPYGVAIALGAALTFLMNNYLTPEWPGAITSP